MADPVYVYTQKGEDRAKALGQKRIKGEIAKCGGVPVWGDTAWRWLEKGYIERKDGEKNA